MLIQEEMSSARWLQPSKFYIFQGQMCYLVLTWVFLFLCRDEGWSQGGIIVQDCTELLNNLLRNNAANQLMFRCVF